MLELEWIPGRCWEERDTFDIFKGGKPLTKGKGKGFERPTVKFEFSSAGYPDRKCVQARVTFGPNKTASYEFLFKGGTEWVAAGTAAFSEKQNTCDLMELANGLLARRRIEAEGKTYMGAADAQKGIAAISALQDFIRKLLDEKKPVSVDTLRSAKSGDWHVVFPRKETAAKSEKTDEERARAARKREEHAAKTKARKDEAAKKRAYFVQQEAFATANWYMTGAKPAGKGPSHGFGKGGYGYGGAASSREPRYEDEERKIAGFVRMFVIYIC